MTLLLDNRPAEAYTVAKDTAGGVAVLFSSMEFLLFFLPVVLGVYFLLPLKARNYWLLLGSLFFYAWGEPVYVVIMILSIAFNYFLALRIEELAGSKAARKLVFVVAIALNLCTLFVFKYLGFLTGTVRTLFPASQSWLPNISIALPIGISFFTFQAMSYVIDVYRGTPAQKNIGYVGLYISFFPQLIAGPIVRYTTIEKQLTERKVTFNTFSKGLIRFMVGFNKKILLANTLANVADLAFSSTGNSVLMAWLGVIGYSLQIYFDFSGYSDMAIGLGGMFGFDFPENFDHPYASATVTEFWRRWHISLGSWFRDYVYFPMGGSRVRNKGRLVLNLMVVWLLTGIWHGANWTFILWGVLLGLVVVTEKLNGIPQKRKSWSGFHKTVYRLWTLLVIMLGWVLFRSESLPAAWTYLRSMFGMSGAALIDDAFIFNAREYIVYLVFGILCCLPVSAWLQKKVYPRRPTVGEVVMSVTDVIQFILFIFSFTFLVMNAHNPFIYFNF